MTQAYYRTWRPKNWDEVTGQDHVIKTLRNAVKNGRITHAYLFSGPRGTGKTTTARLLAKAVNCTNEDQSKHPCNECSFCKQVNEGEFLDLIEIDAASNTSVEDVRDLREKINYSPTQAKYKVYIIDEVHMLSTPAFNALLKTLEEPPEHAIFILATTDIFKIPATVLSRCQRYEFRRISVQQMVDYLRPRIEKEKISIDDDALLFIARQSTGSMRDAISLLDQLASSGEKITLAFAQIVLGTATNQLVIDLTDALIHRDHAKGLEIIQTAQDAGSDARQFARQVVDYLRALMLAKAEGMERSDVPPEIKAKAKEQADQLDNARLLNFIRLFSVAAGETPRGGTWQPGLQLELAVVQAMEYAVLPSSTEPRSTPATQTTNVQRTKPENVPVSSPARSSSAGASKISQKVSEPIPASIQPQKEESTGGNQSSVITQRWKEIKEAVKAKRVPVSGLLNSSTPMIRGNTLTLGFQGEVVRSKMDTPENIELTRQAIKEICGIEVTIRCIVNNRNGTAVPADEDIENDGLVGTALGQGGQIVHKD
jgi:DNA polymerase III subunit gamma/tau